MTELNPMLIGGAVLLAACAVGATATLSARMRGPFVYAQLVLMVGIYVGFAVSAIDAADYISRADWSSLIVACFIAMAFVMGGLAALSSGRDWILGALILGHGAVDVGHLNFSGLGPDWYFYSCVVFDAIAGGAYVWLFSRETS